MIKYNLRRNITPKAKNLWILKKMGINVPDFFTITLSKKDINKKNKIKNKKFLNNIKKFIKSEFLIVRITAKVEDSARASFAGLFSSKIYLSNSLQLENIIDDLEDIDYSKINSYKKNMNINIKIKKRFTVIIQEFVIGDISGIAFTKNPLTKKDEYIIESNFGLNNSLTDGIVTPDTYYICKATNFIKKTIGSKKYIAVLKDNKIALEKNEIMQETLNEKQLTRLIDTFSCIIKKFKTPQDIEWTIYKDKIYILQTRPITTI